MRWSVVLIVLLWSCSPERNRFVSLPDLSGSLAFVLIADSMGVLPPVSPTDEPIDPSKPFRFPLTRQEELAVLAIPDQIVAGLDPSVDLSRIVESRRVPRLDHCGTGLESDAGDRFAWSVDPASSKLFLANGSALELTDDPAARARYAGVALEVPLAEESCRSPWHVRPVGPHESLIPGELIVCGEAPGDPKLDSYFRDLRGGVRLDADRLFAISHGALFVFDRQNGFAPAIVCEADLAAQQIGAWAFVTASPLPTTAGDPHVMVLATEDTQAPGKGSALLEFAVTPAGPVYVRTATNPRGALRDMAIGADGSIWLVGGNGAVLTATSIDAPYHRSRLGDSDLDYVSVSSTASMQLIGAGDGHVYFGSGFSQPDAFKVELLDTGDPIVGVLSGAGALWAVASGALFRKPPSATVWQGVTTIVPHRAGSCAHRADGCGRFEDPGKMRAISAYKGEVLFTMGGCNGLLSYDPRSSCMTVIERLGTAIAPPMSYGQFKTAALGPGPFTVIGELGTAFELIED